MEKYYSSIGSDRTKFLSAIYLDHNNWKRGICEQMYNYTNVLFDTTIITNFIKFLDKNKSVTDDSQLTQLNTAMIMSAYTLNPDFIYMIIKTYCELNSNNKNVTSIESLIHIIFILLMHIDTLDCNHKLCDCDSKFMNTKNDNDIVVESDIHNIDSTHSTHCNNESNNNSINNINTYMEAHGDVNVNVNVNDNVHNIDVDIDEIEIDNVTISSFEDLCTLCHNTPMITNNNNKLFGNLDFKISFKTLTHIITELILLLIKYLQIEPNIYLDMLTNTLMEQLSQIFTDFINDYDFKNHVLFRILNIMNIEDISEKLNYSMDIVIFVKNIIVRNVMIKYSSNFLNNTDSQVSCNTSSKTKLNFEMYNKMQLLNKLFDNWNMRISFSNNPCSMAYTNHKNKLIYITPEIVNLFTDMKPYLYGYISYVQNIFKKPIFEYNINENIMYKNIHVVNTILNIVANHFDLLHIIDRNGHISINYII
jgi:hypothetical protein